MTSPYLEPCPQCGGHVLQPAGAINKALKRGGTIYCGRQCAGLARRQNKTPERRRKEKAEYDKQYRARMRAVLKAKKAAHYQRTRDPEKERERRKMNMPRHVAYCRRPEYRAWKCQYDKKYRAQKHFGPFADAYMALLSLEREINERADFYELAIQKGTVNKTLERKRAYERHQ